MIVGTDSLTEILSIIQVLQVSLALEKQSSALTGALGFRSTYVLILKTRCSQYIETISTHRNTARFTIINPHVKIVTRAF